MIGRREFISVLSMASFVRFQWKDGVKLSSEIYPIYVNTKEIIIDVQPDGVPYKGLFEIPIPTGVNGLVGWNLGVSCENRNSLWLAMLKLTTNRNVPSDEEFGIDHLKVRENQKGQSGTVFLPSGSLIDATDLCLKLNVFNEDDGPIAIHANAWLYFIKG